MVPVVQTKVTFNEAINLILKALKPLGADYLRTLDNGLRSRWVDRYETKGKRSGAFASSSYGNPPYILMNYKADVFSDVFTLAHEAGHSMHTWFAQKHQSFQDYGYPIFLAEVASTFNEALLTHYLLEQADDVQMRAYLIDRQIEDIRQTLFRQTMFAEFEKEVHEIEENGGPLTLEVFREIYRSLFDAYFGPHFVIDDELNIEWQVPCLTRFLSSLCRPFVEAVVGESVKFRGNLNHADSMSRISAGLAVAATEPHDVARSW